jgi:hypothetical protein
VEHTEAVIAKQQHNKQFLWQQILMQHRRCGVFYAFHAKATQRDPNIISFIERLGNCQRL